MAQGSLTFESKQSDYWLIEDTDELVLCSAISSVSATGNEVITSGICDDTVAIYPVIHKINRKTNKKTLLYPSSLNTQVTATSSAGYVFEAAAEPACNADVRIVEISKPIITQNKYNGLFNVIFQGKYSDDKFAIFTYLFQYVDTSMHLVDSFLFIPEEKLSHYKYTFENGYINPNFIIKGIENFNEDFTNILDNPTYNSKPPNYKMKPIHFQDYLRFGISLNAVLNGSVGSYVYNTVGDNPLPTSHTGGFITQKAGRKSKPFKISNRYDKTRVDDRCLRVNFTYRAYVLEGDGTANAQQAYLKLFLDQDDTTNSETGVRGTALGQMQNPADDTVYVPALGSGFCVFFYIPGTEVVTKDTTPDLNSKTFTGIYPQDDAEGSTVVVDPDFKELSLQGVGDSLGYVPSESNTVEFGGNPIKTKGIRADGFFAVGFDIEGEFGTSNNGKPGAAAGADLGGSSTITTSVPNSITVRGGANNDYKVLHRTTAFTGNNLKHFNQTNTAANDTGVNFASGIDDMDVQIDYSYGKLTVSGRVNADPANSYVKLIDNLDLSPFYTEMPDAVKVGLSFSNSSKVTIFDLKEFKVTGSTSKELDYESDVNIQTDTVDKINLFNPDTTIAAQGQGTVISSPDQSTTIFRCQS